MGRKKIKIARINDDRNRSVTYLKRKAGLMKKAHELAVLTGSEVAVIVFGQNGKLTEFCSGDMDRVLLRYTEHSGPVERKGPEHYANDDDDSDEDNDGGEGEDGDGAEGGGTGGGSGSSFQHFSAPQNNGNGGQEKGSGGGKSNKRKARTGHRMTDGHSMSSEGSSRRGSPPSAVPPFIKVEGEGGEDGSGEGGVNRGALKAAIIQRSITRPGANQGGQRSQAGMTHHHSFSGGDLQQRKNMALSATTAPANMTSMPHRPYTAGAMSGMQPSSSDMHSHLPRQQVSPPRFAYSPDGGNNLNPNLNTPNNYLRPQSWTDGSGQQHMMGANSGPSMGSHDLSYGDLAGSPSTISYKVHSQSHSVSSPHAVNAAQNYASLQQSSRQSQPSPSSLLPLAHPILRQHPQYEDYANQLRMQQQQHQGSRNASQPCISVHTAPSSPNHLAAESGHAMTSSASMASLEAPNQGAKRSASFGYPVNNAGKREFQHSVSQGAMPFANNPFDSNMTGEEERSGGYRSGAMGSNADLAPSGGGSANSMPPPPYGQAESKGSNPTAPISNADFNDLMGSILSDMGSTTANSTTPANGSHGSSDERAKESLKEQEDVLRSMESDGSLATLVNNESFDALMSNNGDIIKMEESSPDTSNKQADVSTPTNTLPRITVETRDAGN